MAYFGRVPRTLTVCSLLIQVAILTYAVWVLARLLAWLWRGLGAASSVEWFAASLGTSSIAAALAGIGLVGSGVALVLTAILLIAFATWAVVVWRGSLSAAKLAWALSLPVLILSALNAIGGAGPIGYAELAAGALGVAGLAAHAGAAKGPPRR